MQISNKKKRNGQRCKHFTEGTEMTHKPEKMANLISHQEINPLLSFPGHQIGSH